MLCSTNRKSLRSRVVNGQSNGNSKSPRRSPAWCSSRMTGRSDGLETKNVAKSLRTYENASGYEQEKLSGRSPAKPSKNLKNLPLGQDDRAARETGSKSDEKNRRDSEDDNGGLDLLLETNLFARWLTSKSGQKVHASSFCDDLNDGVILCTVVGNALKLLGIFVDKRQWFKFISYPVTLSEKKQNFQTFMEGCQKLGVNKQNVLKWKDLHTDNLHNVLRLLSILEESIHRHQLKQEELTLGFRPVEGSKKKSKLKQFLDGVEENQNTNDSKNKKNLRDIVEDEEANRTKQRKRLQMLYRIELKKEKKMIKNMREVRRAKNRVASTDFDDVDVVSDASSKSARTSIIEEVKFKRINRGEMAPEKNVSLLCGGTRARKVENRFGYLYSSDDGSVSDRSITSIDRALVKKAEKEVDYESDYDYESDLSFEEEELSLEEKIKLLTEDSDVWNKEDKLSKEEPISDSEDSTYIEVEEIVEESMIINCDLDDLSISDLDEMEMEQLLKELAPDIADIDDTPEARDALEILNSGEVSPRRKRPTLERFKQTNKLKPKKHVVAVSSAEEEVEEKHTDSESERYLKATEGASCEPEKNDSVYLHTDHESKLEAFIKANDDSSKRGDDCNVVRNQQIAKKDVLSKVFSSWKQSMDKKVSPAKYFAFWKDKTRRLAVLEKALSQWTQQSDGEAILKLGFSTWKEQVEKELAKESAFLSWKQKTNNFLAVEAAFCSWKQQRDDMSVLEKTFSSWKQATDDLIAISNTFSGWKSKISDLKRISKSFSAWKESIASEEVEACSSDENEIIDPIEVSVAETLDSEGLKDTLLSSSDDNNSLSLIEVKENSENEKKSATSSATVTRRVYSLAERLVKPRGDSSVSELTDEPDLEMDPEPLSSKGLENDVDTITKDTKDNDDIENITSEDEGKQGDQPNSILNTTLSSSDTEDQDAENKNTIDDMVAELDDISKSDGEANETINISSSEKPEDTVSELESVDNINDAGDVATMCENDQENDTKELEKDIIDQGNVEEQKQTEQESSSNAEQKQLSKEELEEKEVEEMFMALVGILTLVIIVTAFIVSLESGNIINLGVGESLGFIRPRKTLWDRVQYILSFVIRID